MSSRQPSPLRLLGSIVATLLVISVLAAASFDSIGAGFAVIGLIVAIPLLVYLSRPSVRTGFAVLFTCWSGNRALNRGDYPAAERHYRQALSQTNPVPLYDAFLGRLLCQLAEVYRVQGRFDDAEPIYRQALRHYDAAVPYQSMPRAAALHNLATIYLVRGCFGDAEVMFRQALDV